MSYCNRFKALVRAKALDPPHLSSLNLKSSASTSPATPADSIISGRDAAGGGLIAWADLSAAKKWPSQPPRRTSRQLDISSGKWSASIMADRIFRLDRRELVTGLGAAVLSPALPRIAAAQGRLSLMLQAQAGVMALRPGEADTPIWSLLGPAPDISLKRGDELTITTANEPPVGAKLNWYGLC